MSYVVPKLPLNKRSRSAAGSVLSNKSRSGSISARDETSKKIARAKSVLSSRQKVPGVAKIPLSARVNNTSNKPRTPQGRPEQRRMQSARVREDIENKAPPAAPSSPTRHGWALVREKVKTNLPRSSGFVPARRSTTGNATLSDAVRRGNNEVIHLKDQVSKLQSKLIEKDQRLASAKKKTNTKQDNALTMSSSTTKIQKDKIYVRDEEAIRTAEKEKENALAELKVLQARYRSLNNRNKQNETMLKSRIEKINDLEEKMKVKTNEIMKNKNIQLSQMNKINEKYRINMQAKDQSIELMREKLSAFNKEEMLSNNHNVDDYVDAQALRVQVARLAKELHESKSNLKEKEIQWQEERNNYHKLNKKEKLSEVMKIKNSNELKEQMNIMKKALGIQKKRILELESKMKLNVNTNSNNNNKMKKKNTINMHVSTIKESVISEKEFNALKLEVANLNKKLITENKEKKLNFEKYHFLETKKNNEIKSLKNEMNVLTNNLETSNKKIVALNNTLNENNDIVNKKNIEINELKQKIVAMHEEHDLLFQTTTKSTAAEQKIIENLRKTIKGLEIQLKKMNSMKDDMDTLNKKNESLEVRFRSEQSNYTILKKKYNELLQDTNKSKDIIQNLQNSIINDKKKLLINHEKKISDLEMDYENKINELKKLYELEKAKDSEKARKQTLLLNSSLGEEITLLKKQIETLKLELINEKNKYNKLLKDMNEMKKELNLLLQCSNERCKSLEEHCNAIETLSNTEKDRLKSEFKNENDKLKNTILQITAKNDRQLILKNDEIDQLKIQLNAYKKKDKSYIELENQLKCLQKDIQTNNNNVKNVKDQMNELKIKHLNEMKEITLAHEKHIQNLKKKHELALKNQFNQFESTKDEFKNEFKDEFNKELLKYKNLLKKSNNLLEENKKLVAKNKNTIILQKQKHSNEMSELSDCLNQKITILENKINDLNNENKKLKKTMAKKLENELAIQLANKAETMDVEMTKLKNDITHHKRTIKEQIERLRKLRNELEEIKNEKEISDNNNNEKDVSIKKLKSNLNKLKKLQEVSKNKIEKHQNDNYSEYEIKFKEALNMIKELSSLCNSLSEAVVNETKSSGYLANLNVLIKTAEVSNSEKKLNQLKKELSNNKKIHSVLMYNIKYGEKIVSKFDTAIAKKQKKAREDSLNKLEEEIEVSRKKEKRFQETSDNNVDELETLKKGAKEKLIESRKSRKKLTSDISNAIINVLETLEIKK